jgi:surface carbohydrate biosynthesis protein
MKTVLIPIETKAREFIAKLWLSINILSDNIEVILGDKRIVLKEVRRIDPDYYLSLGASEGRKKLFKKISPSTKIGVLDTEGAVTFSDSSVVDNYDYECMNYVDTYFSWGKDQSKKIDFEFKGADIQVLTTGNPRFDLLHKDLRDIYSDSEYTQGFDNFVLFATNFAFANPYKQDSFDHNRPDLVKWQELMTKNYTNVINKLSSMIDDPIILRPHPSASTKKYKKIFDGESNVHVIYEGSARYFISDASAVIHSGSTIGIESNLMDTTTIGFNPETWYSPPELPMLASYKVNSNDKLVDIITRIKREGSNAGIKNPEIPDALKDKLHNHSNPISANLISKSIHSVLAESQKQNTSDINRRSRKASGVRENIERIFYKESTTKIIKRNKKLFKRIEKLTPGNQPTLSGQRFKMFPGTSEEEINSVITRFNDSADISVERVGKWSDLYRLTKNKT